MNLPPLTYLTIDSMSEGVGISQVLPYVAGLAARGMEVTLHSFEKHSPPDAVTARLSRSGVRWRPHVFRGAGTAGGVARVAHGAALVARAELVHARSDLPAASAMLARRPTWLWDVRGFWREDRMALGLLRPGSLPERVLRKVETRAAASSAAIVTLSQRARDVLAERYGDDVGDKTTVITTCVDLERFPLAPAPPAEPLRLLLAGSLSGLYDIDTMVRLFRKIGATRAVELTVLTPTPTPWDATFRENGAEVAHAKPEEMPARVQEHHVGLSIRRFDVGVTGFSATPTKLGEFLATGRPVVVNAGLGDLDDLLVRHDCGVVMRSASEADLDGAVAELDRLLGDPKTPIRCRALAEEHFNVDRGVDRLVEAYSRAVGGRRS